MSNDSSGYCQRCEKSHFLVKIPNIYNFSSIFLDIGEVYSRIFDHRPFTSAEIQYFVREFEVRSFLQLTGLCGDSCNHLFWGHFQEKRNDREVENLFLSLQNTSETKDSGVSKCKVACEGHLDQLQKSLEVALTACQEVSNRVPDPKLQATLEANREDRRKIWSHFVDDMAHKCSRVDHTFEEKEEELRDFYSDLERKLHIHK